MPLEVVRDERRKWICVRGTGSIGLQEILALIQSARSDLHHRLWPMMFDATGATTNATAADVERVVDSVRDAVRREGAPRGHVALVADDDELYACMLLYEARCAEFGVRVVRAFRRLADAEHWLEIVSSARNFL